MILEIFTKSTVWGHVRELRAAVIKANRYIAPSSTLSLKSVKADPRWTEPFPPLATAGKIRSRRLVRNS